jgi:acyl-coenzyme A thioesterase PaaI-like protein
MKAIRNPFVPLEGYNCFGCSPGNPLGLHLKFTEDGDEILSTWFPDPNFQGYFNILHGGIQATLMDEIASWTVYVKVKRAGFTSRAEIRYLNVVGMDKGPLTLRARVKQMRRNLADIEVKLFDCTGLLCADSLLTFFTFSEEKSKEVMYYPDHEKFYEQEE